MPKKFSMAFYNYSTLSDNSHSHIEKLTINNRKNKEVSPDSL